MPQRDSPERPGLVAGRNWSSKASRVGAGKRRGGHRKAWPEPPEPAAGRKESPGGPHPHQAALGGQKARALGRTGPASGDPGMSFGNEGQALSLITRGSGRRLSHGSLCPGACGNWLSSLGSVGFQIVAPPSATTPELRAVWDADKGVGRGVDLAFIHTIIHSGCLKEPTACQALC